MFGFARNGARVASDARRLVDHEPVTQTILLSRFGTPSDVHKKDGTSPPLPLRAQQERHELGIRRNYLTILALDDVATYLNTTVTAPRWLVQ